MFASKDVCTSPVRNVLNAVTFNSLKTNTDLEEVVFLNNMFAPSWIILAGLEPGYCSPAQVKAVQLGHIQSFPVKSQGNILYQEHYCPYWLWNVLPPKCFPESPFLLSHHPILTPSSSFYSLALADSVTQQKAGAAVSHKCRLSSHFQLGIETTVINYCYSCCCLCSKTCFFTPKRVTRSLSDASWPSLHYQGVCVSQYIKGTLTVFMTDFCTAD